MKINERVIVDHLQRQGAADDAAQAESDLPDQVDTGHLSEKLGCLGLDLEDLLSGGR